MRLRTLLAAALGLVTGPSIAPPTGSALAVDAGLSRHAISPDIYGINFYWNLGSGAYAAAAPGICPTLRRGGGNSTATYDWKNDIDIVDRDCQVPVHITMGGVTSQDGVTLAVR